MLPNKAPGVLDSSFFFFFFRANLEGSRLLTVHGILHRLIRRAHVYPAEIQMGIKAHERARANRQATGRTGLCSATMGHNAQKKKKKRARVMSRRNLQFRFYYHPVVA